MFWEFVEKIENEFSGARAKRHAEAIFSWDHTMDFRNFYKSAKYCAESIREAGLGDVEIIRYPADGKGRIGDYVALQAWDVNDAELKIIEPVSEARTIARYREEPLSLAMFSAPTPPEGIDAELILIEQKLPDPQECKGKIAFVTQESPHLFAALEGGAIGYISDSIFSIPHIRDRWAIPDAVCWNFLGPNWPLSFLDPRNKRQHFGYIIPPREGAKLMNTIKRADKEGQKVKAHAWVDSKLYDGDFPLVTGVIPGIQSDREMLLAAHLFEPGALDNAAGCGIALEMARVLNKLILGGHLPKPQMTLRFMFSFEFYGIAAYVSHTEEKAKRIAGSIYFDCIGADQALTKAPLNVVKMPEARPSFLDSLLLHMMHAYYERRDPYFKVGEKSYLYGGFNDPMVAANPMVDIHMTSLIQSPYVQYHTSADVPDILSPWDMLHAGCLTAAFIYSVAHASYKDIVWFIDIVTRQGRQEIEEEMLSTVSAILDLDSKGEQEKTLEKLASLRARLQYKAERIIETQRSVLRIVQELQNIPEALKRQENEIKVNIAQQYDSVLSLLDKGYRDAAIGSTIIKELTPDEQKANSIVPRTVFPARVPMSEWSPEDRKKYKGDVISTSLFWVDGRRTLLEIARMVEQETGKSDVKALVEQFRLLEKNGHVKYDASMV